MLRYNSILTDGHSLKMFLKVHAKADQSRPFFANTKYQKPVNLTQKSEGSDFFELVDIII